MCTLNSEKFGTRAESRVNGLGMDPEYLQAIIGPVSQPVSLEELPVCVEEEGLGSNGGRSERLGRANPAYISYARSHVALLQAGTRWSLHRHPATRRFVSSRQNASYVLRRGGHESRLYEQNCHSDSFTMGH